MRGNRPAARPTQRHACDGAPVRSFRVWRPRARPVVSPAATAWWSRSDSNQPPKCYGTWLVSDQLPWSDTHPDTGSFAVLRDYPGVLRRAVHVGPTGPFLKAGFLEIPLLWKSPSIADFLSASTGVRRGGLVGHPPCSITLWWLVRGCPTRVVGRTRTMFHNTLVGDQVSESQENQAKQQKRPTIWIGVRPG